MLMLFFLWVLYGNSGGYILDAEDKTEKVKTSRTCKFQIKIPDQTEFIVYVQHFSGFSPHIFDTTFERVTMNDISGLS